MPVIKNLIVRAGADFSNLRRETEKAKKTLNDFKSSTERTMSGIRNTLIALGIGKVIKDSISSAMSVEASIQQLDRIMGQNSDTFQKWANQQAIAFNMSQQEALKYGAVYGNLISGFTKSTGETMQYTEQLLKSSAIVASATGRSMEDVMERIRSGMLGNTEAIEDLGINVNVAMIESTNAFKKFANGKSWQQLDFQTQQQIRLFAILEQSSKKYGDTVNNNTSSQLQQLVAQLKNVQLSLGQAFLPIVQIVLPILTNFASQLSYVMGIVAQFSQALFGKGDQQAQVKATTKQASAVGDLGDAYKKTGKEAKKAQGSLAGFDEINSLADKADSGGDSGEDAGGIGAGLGSADAMPVNFDTNAPEISGKVQAMAETVKAKVREIKDTIVANKEIIISVIAGIATAIGTFKTIEFLATVPAMLGALKAALTLLTGPVGIVSASIGGLVAILVYLYQTNVQFKKDVNKIWNDIADTFNRFWNNTLKPIGQYIINDFIKPVAESFKTTIVPVLAEMFLGASQIFNDLVKLLQSTVDNIWGILRPALDLIKTVVIDFLEIIKGLWDKYGQILITNIRNFIQGVQETFQLIWDNIINPIIKPALEMLSWLWTEHLSKLVAQIGEFIMKAINGALELYNGFIKPIVDWMVVTFGPKIANVVSFVVDVFGTMLAGIIDVIKGLFKVLGGVIDFIVGVFTGNWTKAWNGVRDVFKGIFDSLVGIVKVPLNFIIDAINKVIRGLGSIKIDIPDWVPGFGGKTWGINIPTIPKLARGGIVNGPTTALIGEAGPEMVVPLENTSFVDKLAGALGTAVMGAMQFGNSSSSNKGDIILQIDGTTLGRIIGPIMDREQQRIGNSLIVQTI